MARERFELYIPIISRVECKATSRQVRESNRILSKTYNLVAGVMGFLIYWVLTSVEFRAHNLSLCPVSTKYLLPSAHKQSHDCQVRAVLNEADDGRSLGIFFFFPALFQSAFLRPPVRRFPRAVTNVGKLQHWQRYKSLPRSHHPRK